MNVTIDVILYTSKTLTNGNHPLVIRLTQDGKRKYKSLGESFKKSEWDYKKNLPENDDGGHVESLISGKIDKYVKLRQRLKEEEREVSLDTFIDM
ncbi:MAG: site-specific integrase, partial [Bacteroidales bacterium]|nr:site-specific integrase [Bacteroidales bacterium]